jgi:hypothetical protein
MGMIKLSGQPYEGSVVEKFMNDFTEMSHPHPLDPKARILENCSVLLFPAMGNMGIHISSMDSLIRGSGSAALEKLCALADQYGLPISLVAKGYSITPTDRLVNWYTRYGFEKSGIGDNKDGFRMIRKPVTTQPTQLSLDLENPIIKLRGFTRLH